MLIYFGIELSQSFIIQKARSNQKTAQQSDVKTAAWSHTKLSALDWSILQTQAQQ